MIAIIKRIITFFYTKEYKQLKKYIRVIGPQVITFYVMKKTKKFLGGLIEVNSNILMDDYNSSKVSDDEKYFMDMSVHAAAYTILATEWKTMINHIDTEPINEEV